MVNNKNSQYIKIKFILKKMENSLMTYSGQTIYKLGYVSNKKLIYIKFKYQYKIQYLFQKKFINIKDIY